MERITTSHRTKLSRTRSDDYRPATLKRFWQGMHNITWTLRWAVADAVPLLVMVVMVMVILALLVIGFQQLGVLFPR